MLSSRRVRALTASLFLTVATFVVVMPSAALWEPPAGATPAPALQASSPDGPTAHPHMAQSEGAVSGFALPQRVATAMWWLAPLAAIAALVPLIGSRGEVLALGVARPRDDVGGCGWGTRAPPRLLL